MSESQTQPVEGIDNASEYDDGFDPAQWEGPYEEQDKYGVPTGRRYYRCRGCGRMAFTNTRKQLTHGEDCDHV